MAGERRPRLTIRDDHGCGQLLLTDLTNGEPLGRLDRGLATRREQVPDAPNAGGRE